MCADPFGYHAAGEPQDTSEPDVHHIQGVKECPDLLCEAGNLATLCGDCHARIEAMERTGRRTQRLFEGGKG